MAKKVVEDGHVEPQLKDFLKAGYPCVFMPTIEPLVAEERVKDALQVLGMSRVRYGVWKITTGMRLGFIDSRYDEMSSQTTDLVDSLAYVETSTDPVVVVFHNVRQFVSNHVVIQQLQDTIMTARLRGSHVILVGPHIELPLELRSLITWCDCPLPNRNAILSEYKKVTKAYEEEIELPADEDEKDKVLLEAANAAVGLDMMGAENALALTMSSTKTVNVRIIQAQKEQEVRKSDVLEFISAEETMESVGGFRAFKSWMGRRRRVFSDEAREYGLPYPKGVLIVGPAGCQPAGSKVLMASGVMKNIEEVAVGDQVVSPQKDGAVVYANVEEVMSFEDVRLYEIGTTGKGPGGRLSYVASYNHIVPMLELKKERQHDPFMSQAKCLRTVLSERTIEEIYDKGSAWRKNVRARVFTSPPVNFPYAEYKVHPYVIGAFLGDGHVPSMGDTSGAPQITCDSLVLDAIEATGFALGERHRKPGCVGAYAQQPWAALLKQEGLAGKTAGAKHVPLQYLRGSIVQRLELLAGLIDTDGTFQEFASKSEQLAKDFAWLVRSVGGIATVAPRTTCCKEKSFDSFRVQYSFAEHAAPVRLDYKRPNFRDMGWKNPRNFGFDVSYVGKGTVYGFSLSHESQWYVTDDWLVTHNTGKSLVCKGIADFLRLPLLRLDMGKVFRSLVGESEGAMRMALKVAEAVSPVVLWLDEIDKGLAGMKGSGELDSGVTARVVSTILTWRQETKYPVMLAATANDVAAIPAMVYRKGRLDEVWATDLPAKDEREEIFQIHLRKRGRDPKLFGCKMLAGRTVDFVGAEIEGVIEDAMFDAFDESKEVTGQHIVRAISETVPQARRNSEEITAIRKWVETRARLVSGGEKHIRNGGGAVRKIGMTKGSKSEK